MSSTTHWEEAGVLEMTKIWPREFTDSMKNIWMVSGWAVGAIGFEPGVPDLRVRHAPLEENPQMSHQYCLPGGLGCNWGVFQPSPAGLHSGSFFVDMPHGWLWILPLARWLAIRLLLVPPCHSLQTVGLSPCYLSLFPDP